MYFIFLLIKQRKAFRSFVSFLRNENDFETLEKIGARHNGEDLNYQLKVPSEPLIAQLKKKAHETGKKEYVEYLNIHDKTKIKIIILPFIIFLLGCFVSMAFTR